MSESLKKSGVIERICGVASAIAILAMVVIIASEIVARSVFGYSFQVADEYGGYLIAIFTVLSLAICQSQNAFHRVEIVQERLSPRMQAMTRFFFDLVCLALCVILIWQFSRLFMRSLQSGAVAPTLTQTPLWIPHLFLPIGMIALLLPLMRSTIGHFRLAFRNPEEK